MPAVAEVHTFRVGGEQEHVDVSVMGRERPASGDYWDGNWLVTPIRIVVGHFRGEVPADLRAEEIHRFRTELESVYDNLKGEAVLASLDGWISLTVRCRTNGSLEIIGVVNDHPGIGNELTFSLEGLDQSHLPPLIGALRSVEDAYPVLGDPDASPA